MWIRERGDMTESRHNIATKQDGKPLPSSVGQKSAAPLTMYTLKMTGTDSAGFIVTMPCGPIQDEFERMVDALITELASRFGNKLDGIYLYGSIARGNARPNDSDLDVTLVFKDPLTDIQRQEVEKLRVELQERHSEVTKVDFDIGLITDVLDPKNKYSWGYWIKHCCKCVWGNDLSHKFPLLKPSREIAFAINGDFHKVVEDYIAKIVSQKNKKDVLRLKREVSRKLIRSTNVLRNQNDASWPVTLENYYETFCEVCPNECNKLEYILEQANAPDPETDIFTQRVSSFSDWLKSASNIRESL